jgi:hypothetical protein
MFLIGRVWPHKSVQTGKVQRIPAKAWLDHGGWANNFSRASRGRRKETNEGDRWARSYVIVRNEHQQSVSLSRFNIFRAHSEPLPFLARRSPLAFVGEKNYCSQLKFSIKSQSKGK